MRRYNSATACFRSLFLLEIDDLVGVGFPDCISGQAFLAGLKKILAPAVIQIGIDTLLATEFGDRALAPKPV